MDIEEIRKWHKAFKQDNELFEIRVLGDRTWSGYFYDVEMVIKKLEPFDNANIYYSVNEVKKACASREQFDCFKQVKGTATSEQDIKHRWWLPIDIDCERPSGVSSTDEEKSFAHKKAQDVFRFLRENDFSEPIVCDSSSGYHLFYPIDMDNDSESKQAIKAFLETLSNHFSDDKVKIDVVLHDANRIIRLPGTFGRKGRSTSERPHRMAKILSVPNDMTRMLVDKIKSFNEQYQVKIEQPIRYNNYGSQEKFNLHEFIQKYGIKVSKEITLSGGGTKYLLEECPFDSSHKSPDSALFELPNGAFAFKCYHNSCSQYDWRAFRLHFDPHAYDHENESRPQPQYRQYIPQVPQKPKYEIKEEIPELGDKWMSLSKIQKIDLSKIENVKTGFVELDRNIVGLNMTEVTLLSGSNSSGKSSWLNTLLLNIINQGEKFALWSGELPPTILKSWIQMTAAGKRFLRPSNYGDGKYYVPNNISEKIDNWLDGKFFLYNNEYGSKWNQIFNDMNLLMNAGVKVFALDNLMSLDIDLLEGDKNGKQRELMLQIKEFAKKNKVHIILVAHPRKTIAFLRKTDISGSSDITNIVDNCFIIHRVNNDFFKTGGEFFGKAEIQRFQGYGNVLEVCKNRMWGVVDLLVGMHYEIESRRFKNTENEIVRYGWEENMDGQNRTFPEEEEQSDEALPFRMDDDEAPF